MDQKTRKLLAEFSAGTCVRAYELMGCHRVSRHGKAGYVFRVWAPNAQKVSVVGDFNFWDPEDLPMTMLEGGVWEAFTPRGSEGHRYKYLLTRQNGSPVCKADPYGTRTAPLPDTSSVICTGDNYAWGDGKWMRKATMSAPRQEPMHIYEMHLGSWRRKEDGSAYTYEELAQPLARYLLDMGYTHVEFMPLSEYPYDPSWGYQVTGYYAPTARYGHPDGLKKLVDTLHKAGIGVILDWVPAHFPRDEAGLCEFDGTCCYELWDPATHWTTRIFDFGRCEVKSFLVSNVIYWLEKFHIDGIRVDAVSSMLYPDYNRPNYKPNRLGGRENPEAMELLRCVNRAAFRLRPGAIMTAEESTAFPLITKPDFMGGLGFLFKWNMGWMNDTLRYMNTDPVCRQYEHNRLTFPMTYAFSENHVLPLSHDQVGSLLEKMPGDYEGKFANLRALYGYMMAHPGKKLTFMGNELAQLRQWRFSEQLDWNLLEFDRHRQMQDYVRELNRFYRRHPQLWQDHLEWEGYQWIQPDAAQDNLLAFRRIDSRHREVLVICNFCPTEHIGYRLGVPRPGIYKPVLSSAEPKYGGTWSHIPAARAQSVPFRGYKLSAQFHIPPMSTTYYIRENLSKKAST